VAHRRFGIRRGGDGVREVVADGGDVHVMKTAPAR
jgi:hypothetical protein